MKITIDSALKTIKVESPTTLGEIVDFMDRIMPGQWREYTLEANVITQNIPSWQPAPWTVTDPYKITLGTGDYPSTLTSTIAHKPN